MTENQSSDSGSFVTGFTIGVFAGALGYFAFGTKRGAAVREQVAQEWEKAREHLVKETAVEGADVSFGDVAGKIKDFASLILTGVVESTTTKEKTGTGTKTKKSTSANSKPKKQKKLFKGV